MKLSGSTLLRYQDGKIVEKHAFMDDLDWQQQLGFTLTPAASAEAPALQ